MHALYIVAAGPRHLGDRLPLLQRVHRGEGHGARRLAGHAGASRNSTAHNYYPTSRWVLFGHHFAAIAGAGPLIGPVLAAQFGYAPGLHLARRRRAAWPARCTISSCLWASTRRGGRSLADIARTEIGPVAGTTAAVAILFIIDHRAGRPRHRGRQRAGGERVGHVHDRRDHSDRDSRWASTCSCCGRASITEATIVGVVADDPRRRARTAVRQLRGSAPVFVLSRHQITAALAVYGFAASVLPVWMLLTPRDYLSTFMKIGTIAVPRVGVIVVNPTLQAPAFSQFVAAAARSSPGRCSRSSSSRSRAARSPASTR